MTVYFVELVDTSEPDGGHHDVSMIFHGGEVFAWSESNVQFETFGGRVMTTAELPGYPSDEDFTS